MMSDLEAKDLKPLTNQPQGPPRFYDIFKGKIKDRQQSFMRRTDQESI